MHGFETPNNTKICMFNLSIFHRTTQQDQRNTSYLLKKISTTKTAQDFFFHFQSFLKRNLLLILSISKYVMKRSLCITLLFLLDSSPRMVDSQHHIHSQGRPPKIWRSGTRYKMRPYMTAKAMKKSSHAYDDLAR